MYVEGQLFFPCYRLEPASYLSKATADLSLRRYLVYLGYRLRGKGQHEHLLIFLVYRLSLGDIPSFTQDYIYLQLFPFFSERLYCRLQA